MPVSTPPSPGDRPGLAARRVAVLLPLAVLLAMGALLAWSAWPVLRPAREVRVVQAVFDRSASPREPAASAEPVRPSASIVQAPGWLEAEPYLVACTALADGVVETIEVLEGDFVESGRVVARLVADDAQLRLQSAQAELARTTAGLDVARAAYLAAQQLWDQPVELERAVEAGRASLDASRAELAQLPSLITSANATLVRLREEASRIRRSSEQGAANEFELLVADQRAAAQAADVDALRARGAILQARVDRAAADYRAAQRDLDLRIEDRRRLDTAEGMLTQARALVAGAQARVDEAELELERMVIRAPISGYVQRRLKLPGDKVVRMMDSPHSAHLVHLYDPSRIQVRVDVPLADASGVAVGQPCEVVVEVLPDREFRGEVLRTTHEADLQKNTLQFKVKILDPDPVLRPEMLARVKFLPFGTSRSGADAPTPAPRVLVPEQAVREDAGRARVWLVTDRRRGRGVLASAPVQVLARANGWATVSGPLEPGTLVAVGLDEPREGETVRVQDGGAS